MTIPELFAQGVRTVRLPVWNRFAYLELFEHLPGQLASTGRLWDIGCPGRVVPILREESDEYEAWVKEERLTGLSEHYIHAVYYGE